MERAVKRGRQRKAPKVVRRLGVDEKAAAKGHRYLTLVCDLEEGTVEHIAEERKKESLDGYYQGISEEQLAGIEAVAMDMWEPYIQATRQRVPEAAEKIVFDDDIPGFGVRLRAGGSRSWVFQYKIGQQHRRADREVMRPQSPPPRRECEQAKRT